MTSLHNLYARAKGRYAKVASETLFRRPLPLRLEAPIVSFTFDDFPASAYRVGGGILRQYNGRGTYYAALGLMGHTTCVGEIFCRDDLTTLIEDGHELGCHTFDHLNAGTTSPGRFEASIATNAKRLTELLPAASFRTMSYPIAYPRPHTKRRSSRHFDACRCGGQSINLGTADLSLLRAFFLERCGYDLNTVRRMISECCEKRGWLIFATHDVCAAPTEYGCTPQFFEDVVRFTRESGARILPVHEALRAIGGSSAGRQGSQ